jgi:hypothetical protein
MSEFSFLTSLAILGLDLCFAQEDRGSGEVAWGKLTAESLSSIAAMIIGEIACAGFMEAMMAVAFMLIEIKIGDLLLV